MWGAKENQTGDDLWKANHICSIVTDSMIAGGRV